MIEPGFTNGRWAVMVDKPMETASALVYSKEAGQRYPIEIVSTLAAAASFLGKDLSGQGLA
ncbi:hypothetical protein [Thiorhodococcus minor]|uniref:Uncharacterized protein n=1 Tax=Thiorhodococcus minor TaxID=57489 RepID=A0A6M0JWP8_9GAMM|nr:hypothetical protein [Thiorhodococcus minor]NEV60727.1 hypothetical protein [Thiorhodococcus minor]